MMWKYFLQTHALCLSFLRAPSSFDNMVRERLFMIINSGGDFSHNKYLPFARALFAQSIKEVKDHPAT